ncbi:MAG: hypothetical protein U9R25_12085 [Chloroflexota bacterium]|nr:hypothetical protein [Chloroflexota bacterium]
MNDQEKLRVLIPHWIEHNDEHAAEFRRWADKAGVAAPDILAAAEAVVLANEALASALDKLGGPAEQQHHHAH